MPRLASRVIAASLLVLAVTGAAAAEPAPTPLAQCMATTATRLESHACLEAERKRADEAVAQAHRGAKALAEDLGRTTGRHDVARALAKSQRAWQTYRDAECRLAYEILMPGTGAGDASLDCAIRLARERAAALKALAQ
jgi:uncharacterized protein YecT (DUF1311 family)